MTVRIIYIFILMGSIGVSTLIQHNAPGLDKQDLSYLMLISGLTCLFLFVPFCISLVPTAVYTLVKKTLIPGFHYLYLGFWIITTIIIIMSASTRNILKAGVVLNYIFKDKNYRLITDKIIHPQDCEGVAIVPNSGPKETTDIIPRRSL